MSGDTLEQALIPCDPAVQGRDCTALTGLQQTLEVLRHYPSISVRITGHTDSEECADGDDCARLGAARAVLVHEYLLAHGIDAARIVSVVGYGNNHSLAAGSGGDLMVDRRVDVDLAAAWQRSEDAIRAAYEALEAELRGTDELASRKPASWQYRIEAVEFDGYFVVTFTPRVSGEGAETFRFEVPQDGGEVRRH